jgi:hypothetical protein
MSHTLFFFRPPPLFSLLRSGRRRRASTWPGHLPLAERREDCRGMEKRSEEKKEKKRERKKEEIRYMGPTFFSSHILNVDPIFLFILFFAD